MPETTLALARTLLDSAVLAFSATLVLLLIVEAAFYVHVRLPRRSIFAHNLLNRPGADLRSRRIKLRGRLYLYSFASLMFLLTFAVILIGHPDPFVRSFPAWAQITVGMLVLMGILHLIVRAVVIKLALRPRSDPYWASGPVCPVAPCVGADYSRAAGSYGHSASDRACGSDQAGTA